MKENIWGKIKRGRTEKVERIMVQGDDREKLNWVKRSWNEININQE
jgi:hypothetical protein